MWLSIFNKFSQDTYNTLKYADRAKRIKVKLRRNTAAGGAGGVSELQLAQTNRSLECARAALAQKEAECAQMRKEMEELRNQLLRQQASKETAEQGTQSEFAAAAAAVTTSTSSLPVAHSERCEMGVQVPLFHISSSLTTTAGKKT